jgi:hypothetical protein
MESEEAYKEPTTPPNAEKDKLFLDWSKTFKILDLYISAMRGDTSKIPLGYIIRETEKPWNAVHSTPKSYMGTIELMNDYCPHWDLDTTTNAYQQPYYYDQDNHKVLQILLEIFQSTPAYTYIEKFTRKWDGRGAYWALYNHYLGEHNATNMVTKALAALHKLQYTGESRNFNWEKYVNKHEENHNILQSMVGRGDYKGMLIPVRPSPT